MPTYEYQCKSCGHALEEFQSMSEEPLTRCPKCGTDSLIRIMGSGSGLIFKGTGFYLTDYRKSSAKPSTPSKDTGKGDSGKGDSGKGDSGKGDSGKGDSGKGDSGKGDSGKGASGKGDTRKKETTPEQKKNPPAPAKDS
jgi:putative FmdB family regulatory protein